MPQMIVLTTPKADACGLPKCAKPKMTATGSTVANGPIFPPATETHNRETSFLPLPPRKTKAKNRARLQTRKSSHAAGSPDVRCLPQAVQPASARPQARYKGLRAQDSAANSGRPGCRCPSKGGGQTPAS